MLAKSKNTEQRVIELERKLRRFPEGELFCRKNGNHTKWYKGDGHTHTYIPKKDRVFAEQLAAKKYLTLEKEYLLQEKRAIDAYLEIMKGSMPAAEDLLEDTSPYRELIMPHFKPKQQRLEEWVNGPFRQNPNYPEHLIHKSISGHMVRSKSEMMIDAALFERHIAFRYDAELCVGDIILYPDFTIIHPKTEKIVYWEHLGLMDKSRYLKNTLSKLQIYSENGIVPSVNLILTAETLDQPLSIETIERTIRFYLQ